MTNSEVSSTLDHAHLLMTRDRRAMTVVREKGLVIEAILLHNKVALTTYDALTGVPYGAIELPLSAFDEMLDMVIACA